MDDPIVFEKERSFKQLIGDTFSFLFQEFSTFFSLLAKLYGPLIILTFCVYFFYPHFISTSQSGFYMEVSNPKLPEWINYILYFVNIFYLTLFVNAYIELYRKGEDINAASLWKSFIWHFDRYSVMFLITAGIAAAFAIIQSRYDYEEQIKGTIIFSILIWGFSIFFILRYSLALPLLSSTLIRSGESFKISSQLIKGRILMTFAGFLILCFISYILKASFYFTLSLILNPIIYLKINIEFFENLFSALLRIHDMLYIFSISVLINVFNYFHYANQERNLVYEDNQNEMDKEGEIDE